MKTLKRLVLVKFTLDKMVTPRESEWFGQYVPGTSKEILPMEGSPGYKNDWIGLRSLDSSGRITKLACEGDHLQMPEGWFRTNIIPFLNE